MFEANKCQNLRNCQFLRENDVNVKWSLVCTVCFWTNLQEKYILLYTLGKVSVVEGFQSEKLDCFWNGLLHMLLSN